MTDTGMSWRLDVNAAGHGRLIVRADDPLANAEAHGTTSVAGYVVSGAPARVLDPQVGPSLAYPVVPSAYAQA